MPQGRALKTRCEHFPVRLATASLPSTVLRALPRVLVLLSGMGHSPPVNQAAGKVLGAEAVGKECRWVGDEEVGGMRVWVGMDETVAGRDAGYKRTRTYSQRVSSIPTRARSPMH